MALVLDTGPILALLDLGDPDHARCLTMVEEVGEDLYVPATVLVEVDYWVIKLLGLDTWTIFLEDVASGAYRLQSLDESDYRRAGQIESEYPDLDLGLVDASVMALCERLGETKVATLDRRDFSTVRPAHCDYLQLLPE